MKLVHKVFVVAVMAILTAGLIRTLWFPKEINGYENRYAEQMPAVTAAGYLSGQVQDQVDAALMDQVHGAQYMKRLYNQTKARYVKEVLDTVTAGMDRETYRAYGGLRLYGDDYIVNWTRTLDYSKEALDKKITALNKTFAGHPELDFYLYYIEKDTDLDFTTGEKSGLPEYLLPRLDMPRENQGVFRVDSFAEFSKKFYKTDTHWNYMGAHEAYQQLVELLGCSGSILEPEQDAQFLGSEFSGVKAGTVGADGIFTEDFYAYPYAFPPMTVTINGQPAQDYGDQAAFLAGEYPAPLTYGSFYGGDNGETVLSTGTQGRGELLVIGESFDNALLKLLASHYDTLYSVDLRYYEHSMGQPFDLTAYTQAHGITQVLLIGNIDYFVQDTFDPEG